MDSGTHQSKDSQQNDGFTFLSDGPVVQDLLDTVSRSPSPSILKTRGPTNINSKVTTLRSALKKPNQERTVRFDSGALRSDDRSDYTTIAYDPSARTTACASEPIQPQTVMPCIRDTLSAIVYDFQHWRDITPQITGTPNNSFLQKIRWILTRDGRALYLLSLLLGVIVTIMVIRSAIGYLLKTTHYSMQKVCSADNQLAVPTLVYTVPSSSRFGARELVQ